jgi:hypothetical protein
MSDNEVAVFHGLRVFIGLMVGADGPAGCTASTGNFSCAKPFQLPAIRKENAGMRREGFPVHGRVFCGESHASRVTKKDDWFAAAPGVPRSAFAPTDPTPEKSQGGPRLREARPALLTPNSVPRTGTNTGFAAMGALHNRLRKQAIRTGDRKPEMRPLA